MVVFSTKVNARVQATSMASDANPVVNKITSSQCLDARDLLCTGGECSAAGRSGSNRLIHASRRLTAAIKQLIAAAMVDVSLKPKSSTRTRAVIAVPAVAPMTFATYRKLKLL